jgi:hypothetical protein
MHSKYVTLASSTQAQVINDIAKLLSGSPISALSASCDKVNSTLISTVAPGWTLFDAAAPLNGNVLSASDADALTTKYVRIFGPSGTTIDITANETWNAGTHAGTNPANASGVTVPYSTNAVNTYWIFGTPRSIFITNGALTGSVGVFEFTRDAAYLTGSTYPAQANASCNSFQLAAGTLALPRSKNLVAAGDLTAAAASAVVGTIAARGVTGRPGSPNTTIQDGSGNLYHEMRPLFAMVNQSGGLTQSAILGKIFDIMEVTLNAGAALDTFSDGTSTWMILPPNTITLALKVA